MHTTEKETLYVILMAFFALAVIIMFFISSLIRQHRKYKALYKENIKAEINTLEKERKRLSGDLHDELGPTLSGVKLTLLGVQNLSAVDSKAVSNVLRHVDKMVDQIRNISYGLTPPALEVKGLVYVMETYINSLKTPPDLTIHFNHDNNVHLSTFYGLNVYRILQEIIHNTIKHAGAAQLHIYLSLVKNKLIINTSDNGKGFDYKAVIKKSDGLGLPNLQSRVDILHGNFSLTTSPLRGTSYSIEIPLDDNKI